MGAQVTGQFSRFEKQMPQQLVSQSRPSSAGSSVPVLPAVCSCKLTCVEGAVTVDHKETDIDLTHNQSTHVIQADGRLKLGISLTSAVSITAESIDIIGSRTL